MAHAPVALIAIMTMTSLTSQIKTAVTQKTNSSRAKSETAPVLETETADTTRQEGDIVNAPVEPCSWVEEESETFPRQRLDFDY